VPGATNRSPHDDIHVAALLLVEHRLHSSARTEDRGLQARDHIRRRCGDQILLRSGLELPRLVEIDLELRVVAVIGKPDVQIPGSQHFCTRHHILFGT
jgi:hypothetical protein